MKMGVGDIVSFSSPNGLENALIIGCVSDDFVIAPIREHSYYFVDFDEKIVVSVNRTPVGISEAWNTFVIPGSSIRKVDETWKETALDVFYKAVERSRKKVVPFLSKEIFEYRKIRKCIQTFPVGL